MKKICLIISLLLFAQIAFASENIITALIIDNQEEKEIDVLMDKDQMYLPCKYFLTYFAIPFKENHVDKSLSFKNITVKANSYVENGVKQKYPVYFLKTCMTGAQNEFFIPAETLTKITDKQITANSQELIVYLKTKEDIPQTASREYENPFLIKTVEQKAQAYDSLAMPVQKGWISLDSVGMRQNILSDSYSQIYRDTQSKNFSYNNNMQLTFAGKLNSGKYKIDMGTNSYSQNLFAFSGINPKYTNQFRKFDYVLGKVDPWDIGDDDKIQLDVMGAQLKDHISEKSGYKDLEGYVNQNSIVKVTINDTFEKELSTYGGYYSLKDVYYPDKIKKLKIEEILADGTAKEIFEKEYKGDENKKEIPKRDFILGVTGLQDRIFANNGSFYQANTKKTVVGFKYHKELSDKLSFENFVIADQIIADSENNIWNQSILGNRKYLNYTTLQNQNVLQGESYMGVLSYKNNEKMNTKFYFGGSHSISKDAVTLAGLGYHLRAESIYHVDEDTLLKGSVFATSPEFYMAGSSLGAGGIISDKIGASASANKTFKNISLGGTYSKYKSNFGNYYEGGLLDFDEYTLNARTNFKKLPNIYLRINNKKGVNGVGEITSGNYELSAEKRFKYFDIKGGIRKNDYSNQYSAPGYSSYSSEYSDIFTEVNFPLGKRFGNMMLGHDIVKTTSDGIINNYNSFNIGYSTPTIKGINFNLMTGIHYNGTNPGNDWGMGISKRLKSGSMVSLNYRYSAIPCYMIDNMYLPGSMRHSISLNFSELYGMGNNGLHAIGTGNENKGYLQVRAFLDLNQNGVKDKGEPAIENIPIIVDNSSDVLLTDKKGLTEMKTENEGIYNVKIYEDELPTLVSCHNQTKPSRYIKIKSNLKTDIAFGLISSVGNINGSVSITDEYNNPLKIEDLVVSVLDTSGNEVSYTNINDDGTFSFSGLNPGKYFVTIDKNLQEAYKIKPDAKSENYLVEIPPVYKDYVNIDNVNLGYKYEI